MKVLFCFILVALLLAPGISFGGDTSVTTVTNETKTNLSQGVVFNNNSKNNTSIGSLGNYPFGQFPIAPEFPPAQARKITPNSVIFSNLPSVITRKIVKNYKRGLCRKKGRDFLGKMREGIKTTPIVFQKYPKTPSIVPFPKIPNGLKEGKDYTKVAVWSFSAKDKVPSKWDFALLLAEKGMNLGADLVIPIGENARFIFQNKAGAFSLFGAFAQIFGSTPWGMNISPGGGISSGSGEIQTLPSMTVAFIRVLDRKSFWAAANVEFAPKKISKKPEKTKPIKEEKEVEKTREEISDYNGRLLHCPFASQANARLRNKQGQNYLSLFIVTKGNKEQNKALDSAFLNFSQALRDGPSQEIKREVYKSLATISLEKSSRVSGKRKEYLKKTLRYSKKAGISSVPTPSALVESWK